MLYILEASAVWAAYIARMTKTSNCLLTYCLGPALCVHKPEAPNAELITVTAGHGGRSLFLCHVLGISVGGVGLCHLNGYFQELLCIILLSPAKLLIG